MRKITHKIETPQTEYPNRFMTCAQLRLADRVRLSDGPYGDATVSKVTETETTFFRPYVHTADFSYTGGVICYVGIEEFSRPRSENATYFVYERRVLK